VQPHTPAGRCSTQEKDGQPRRADAGEEVLLPRAAGTDHDRRAAGGGGRRSTPGRVGADGELTATGGRPAVAAGDPRRDEPEKTDTAPTGGAKQGSAAPTGGAKRTGSAPTCGAKQRSSAPTCGA